MGCHMDKVWSHIHQQTKPASGTWNLSAVTHPLAGYHVWKTDLESFGGLQLSMCNRYQGSFVQGLRHGHGTYHYATGARYKGEWRNNVKEGMGSFIYEDGTYFEGDFANDKPVNRIQPKSVHVQLSIDDLLEEEISPEKVYRLVSNALLRTISELKLIYRYYSTNTLPMYKMDTMSTPGSGIADHILAQKKALGMSVRLAPKDLDTTSYTLKQSQLWQMLADCLITSDDVTMADVDGIVL